MSHSCAAILFSSVALAECFLEKFPTSECHRERVEFVLVQCNEIVVSKKLLFMYFSFRVVYLGRICTLKLIAENKRNRVLAVAPFS